MSKSLRFSHMGLYLLVPAIVLLSASCANSRKVIYFNNVTDSSFLSASVDLEPVIQKNDLLSITVSSLNPQATEIFNKPSQTANLGNETSAGTSAASGYLVGTDGNITFPLLGRIKAVGLTKLKLTELITNKLIENELLVEPIVNIRFLNFRITVLGEVAHPTVVTVANERISILEAIGLAGDLTIYGRKDNVSVIREEGNRKVIRRLNLNSGDIFLSPYYYLKSNDIVYVEPNKTKIRSASNTRQLLPIILSGLSIVAIIVTRNHY